MNATDVLLGAAFGEAVALPDVPADVVPAGAQAEVVLANDLVQAVDGLAEAEMLGAKGVAKAIATAIRRLRRVELQQQPAIADMLGKAFSDALKARGHAQAPQRAADFRAILRAAVADQQFVVPEVGLQAAAKAARAVVKVRPRAAGAGRQAVDPRDDPKAVRAAMRIVYRWVQGNNEALAAAIRIAAADAGITLV